MLPLVTDQVFIIRLMFETEAERGRVAPRVRITYVNDKRKFYANGLEGAFAIVRSILAEAGYAGKDDDRADQ